MTALNKYSLINHAFSCD